MDRRTVGGPSKPDEGGQEEEAKTTTRATPIESAPHPAGTLTFDCPTPQPLILTPHTSASSWKTLSAPLPTHTPPPVHGDLSRSFTPSLYRPQQQQQQSQPPSRPPPSTPPDMLVAKPGPFIPPPMHKQPQPLHPLQLSQPSQRRQPSPHARVNKPDRGSGAWREASIDRLPNSVSQPLEEKNNNAKKEEIQWEEVPPDSICLTGAPVIGRGAQGAGSSFVNDEP